MILPNVRSSFGREEVDALVALLSRDDERRERDVEAVLSRKGIDALLDDPRTLQTILERREMDVLPSRLVFYILVRRALLEGEIRSREIADYVTALVLEFGQAGRSGRVAADEEGEYRYLVDILEELATAEGRRAFLLQAHLGNFALWLSGLFPDYIMARVRRKGGPGLDYYEEMGEAGFRMASEAPDARERSLGELYRGAAESFGSLRRSLNRISDRFLFPRPSSPVERLLRQAGDGFSGSGPLPH